MHLFFIFFQLLSCWMLKQPSLKSSGLYISVFQDRPDKGALNMFKTMLENSSFIRKRSKMIYFFVFLDKPRAHTGRTDFLNIFNAPNITKLSFFNFRQYCHHRSDNYITIPIEVGPGI